MRRAPLIASLAIATLLAACVTERTGPRPPASRTSRPAATTAGAQRARPGSAPPLPSSPIARPAGQESTFVSHVVVSVIDLGGVPYDGLVLPLVSPDGRFLAVQSGQAPSWPTLLALPESEPPQGTLIAAYALADAAPAPGAPPSLQPLTWPAELPPGLVLGRSCDSRGFLVESPREDGARWIGRVEWATGALTWLVRNASVNAHAVLGPSGEGELAYTRRRLDNPETELVYRARAGAPELVFGDRRASIASPIFTGERSVLYAFAVTSEAIEVLALRLPGTPGEADQGPITVTARRQLARAPQAATPYQAAAALQIPHPSPQPPASASDGSQPAGAPAPDPTLAFFHPGMRRMALFNRRTGALWPFPPDSIAAVPTLDPALPGFFTTTAKGLTFSTANTGHAANRTDADSQSQFREVPVLAEPLIARKIDNPAWPYVLLGPDRRSPESSFRVYKMRVGQSEQTPEIDASRNRP